jgi:hypothetical protein
MKNEFSPSGNVLMLINSLEQMNAKEHQTNAQRNDQFLAAAAQEICQRYTLIYDPEMMFS